MKFIEITGNSDEKIEKLKNLGITTEGFMKGVSELEEVINGIRENKVPEKNFTVDLTIARGLDYYIGISIGLTRFFYQMKKENILKEQAKSISKVLVAPMSNSEIGYALDVANAIRRENINTETYLEDKKLKAKFKYADKLNIKYVVVIGEEEAKNNTVTLKNMETGEQETATLDEIIEKIK